LRNRGLVDADGINSRWGYALESEILILNELKEPEAKERRALSNKLKPIIAAPPDTLTIERKGLHPYDMVNRLFVLAFTNDPVPLSLPPVPLALLPGPLVLRPGCCRGCWRCWMRAIRRTGW
jgi:hypothetical protein